jgi:putative FmdB family regulatory protein
MPIYDYVCSACHRLTEVVHGITADGPHFCPECGAEGTMTKVFSAPSVHFKGSGWAKKDRGSSSRAAARSKESGGSGESGGDGSSSSSDSWSSGETKTTTTDKTPDTKTASKNADGAGGSTSAGKSESSTGPGSGSVD